MNAKFMTEAIKEAKAAAFENEVPVGAVIVKNGEIIAKERNRREKNNDATAHAELLAKKKACKKLNSWRLNDCELYVTLEPCPMCAGAIINSRIKTVVFGAFDKKGGAVESKVDLFSKGFNHKPEIYGGVCEKECAELLKKFFEEKRK